MRSRGNGTTTGASVVSAPTGMYWPSSVTIFCRNPPETPPSVIESPMNMMVVVDGAMNGTPRISIDPVQKPPVNDTVMPVTSFVMSSCWSTIRYESITPAPSPFGLMVVNSACLYPTESRSISPRTRHGEAPMPIPHVVKFPSADGVVGALWPLYKISSLYVPERPPRVIPNPVAVPDLLLILMLTSLY